MVLQDNVRHQHPVRQIAGFQKGLRVDPASTRRGVITLTGSASTCVELSLKAWLAAGMHWHAEEIELGSWSERSNSKR